MSDDADHIAECPGCGQTHLITDLVFPEPEDEASTQYNWLVARCPSCDHDLNLKPAVILAAMESQQT